MPVFAAVPPHAAVPGSAFVVQVLSMFFFLASFMVVAIYVTKQVREGRFLNGENAPPSYSVSGAFGFFFIASVLGLVFLGALSPQSALPSFYPMMVLFGIAGILMQDGRTAWQQFGLGRMDTARLVSWSLFAFGSVVLVGNPLYEGTDWLLSFFHVPHPEQDSVETFSHVRDPLKIAAYMFEVVLLGPVIEELFFRGFLLTFLRKYTSTWMALVLSGGVFAFAHVNLAAVLPLWLLGVVLGIAYEQTGSLLLPIGIHACFNLYTALSILLDRGTA